MKKAEKLFKELLNENLGYIDLKPINQIEATPKTNFEIKFAEFLAEEAKAVEKKTSKEVEEVAESNFDYKDVKNLDNQIGQEVLNGIYFEAKQNPDKSLDEIREIVSKNLAKDGQYYLKNAAFGIEGLGLEEMKQEEVSGDHKSSGYSDKLKEVVKEALTEGKKKESTDSKLAEIDKQAQVVALEAKIEAVAEMIESKTDRLNMVSEDENLAELVDKKALKSMQKEIKILEKRKAKMEKMYEKMCGKSYQQEEIVDEVEEINESPAANLELKNLAKQLFLGFKKIGANVELVTDKAVLNKAKTGDLDEKDVFISALTDDIVTVTLVGDKAIGFEDKIKNDPQYSKFEFVDSKFDGETWGGAKTRSFGILPGATTSE